MNYKERKIFDEVFNIQIHKANSEQKYDLMKLLINMRTEIKQKISEGK